MDWFLDSIYWFWHCIALGVLVILTCLILVFVLCGCVEGIRFLLGM